MDAGLVPPAAASAVFGERLPLVVRYAEWLRTDGVVRGVIGPREVDRLWDRHLLNCAVVAELIEPGRRVVDVGSGAGLPGIVLALARPDLTVVLVDSQLRRVRFLTETTERLELAGVRVVRGRAEEQSTRAEVGAVDIVIARAVAPLGRLVDWCLPLLDGRGRLLAIKGEQAAAELDGLMAQPSRSRLGETAIRYCGVGVVEPPTTVIDVSVG